MPTEQEVKDEYKQLFQMYDKGATGKLSKDQIIKIIADAHINLEQKDWDLIFEGVDDSVDVDKFTQMFMSYCVPPFSVQEISSAFKVFDKAGTKFANEGELKYVLENLGKDIPKDVIEDFLKQGKPDDKGNIDYAAYAKVLIER